MKHLTYRGQTYTPSNQADTVNSPTALTYRGQSYQPCYSPLTTIAKAKLMYRGVPYYPVESFELSELTPFYN